MSEGQEYISGGNKDTIIKPAVFANQPLGGENPIALRVGPDSPVLNDLPPTNNKFEKKNQKPKSQGRFDTLGEGSKSIQDIDPDYKIED